MTGDGTTGDGTTGDGTSGGGTNGTSGDSTLGNSTSGDGTTGNGTTADGRAGDGTAGDGQRSRERLRPARLSAPDLWLLSLAGLRSKPLRAVLSAAGIAIGIAAMVAVMGISTSSHADLDRTLDRLGTNLLRVSAGQTVFGTEAELPGEAVPMVRRLPPVTRVSATAAVDAEVFRSDLIPKEETNALKVLAARTDLLRTLGGTAASGTWLNRATAEYPAVVLGSVAAQRLGVTRADPDVRILLGDRWFTVVGVLDPVVLAPELDSSALIGYPVAEEQLGLAGGSSTLYVRAEEEATTAVRGVLARTVNPEQPETVEISRPSDALVARAAADQAYTGLLLGIGAVALLIGGIGVANTMVITVLERRGEIGLRRALGATRGQVRSQFLSESLLLAALGGAAGTVLGALITAGYAGDRGWPVVLPVAVPVVGIAGTLCVGALAGLYPAVRAARVTPSDALAGT